MMLIIFYLYTFLDVWYIVHMLSILLWIILMEKNKSEYVKM